MKKILLMLLAFSVDARCMDKRAIYLDVVHSGVEGPIIAKVVSNDGGVKLLGHEFEEKDQLNLIEEEDSLGVVVFNADGGTIGIYSSEDPENSLLNFVVQKSSNHTPATVNFVNIGRGLRAALYRPSMSGGDSFVLALGRKESDISVSTVQEAQQFGYLQMFFPVSSMVGQ